MRYAQSTVNALTEHVLSGGKTVLGDEHKRILQRVKVAYMQVMEHFSDRQALVHLQAFHGDAYSEDTCRGDIQLAKALFGAPTEGDKQWTKGVVKQANLEMLRKAMNDRDAKGVAAISQVLIKIDGLDKDNERPFDPEQLRNPVPRIIVFDPRLAGAVADPELEEKVNKLLDKRRAAGVNVPKFLDTPFTEVKQNDSTAG